MISKISSPGERLEDIQLTTVVCLSVSLILDEGAFAKTSLALP